MNTHTHINEDRGEIKVIYVISFGKEHTNRRY